MLLFHRSQGNAGSLGGCEAAEAAMRSHEAVVVAPGGQHPSRMGLKLPRFRGHPEA
jgi:hypothetical protein